VDKAREAEDLAFYAEHFDYLDPREPALREARIDDLAARCPVTRSDAWGGFWVVNNYADAAAICLDPETFSSAPPKRITPLTGRPMPPIDFDPPALGDYRRILNPLLTPRRLAALAPEIRAFVTELIDDFIEDGSCDLSGQFAKPFPARFLYRFLFGTDDADAAMVQEWTVQILCRPRDERTPAIKEEWHAWIRDLIDRRRGGPRREDLIDALLHGTVEGQPITDEEIAGCIENLTFGGFSTTGDTIDNAIYRLAGRPDLRERLRADPSLIPTAIDEFLRFDSPVGGVARLCTRDTVVGGRAVSAGERVFMFLGAANRDQAEFDHPDDLDIDRERNRHLAFGLGHHRCIGSNVGRLNVTIALEELLSRLGDFRVTPGDEARRVPSPAWGIDYLPLTFEPGPRRTPRAS
jgi:cytochrome P450